ncbi:hypothetical protein MIND_01375100 [Mycena indigotica]|uniref:Uncharacterized protein n=1 Tax=Mycena indigotica TaxID=2126181 RepID=A0A8H6VRB9_9AGAR|nr:uncharacterized protein MIND_01375100 [Mycena indigotica]KAF7289141.1 hypothetical protein MIND_01375100 [Mycena indigotica]
MVAIPGPVSICLVNDSMAPQCFSSWLSHLPWSRLPLIAPSSRKHNFQRSLTAATRAPSSTSSKAASQRCSPACGWPSIQTFHLRHPPRFTDDLGSGLQSNGTFWITLDPCNAVLPSWLSRSSPRSSSLAFALRQRLMAHHFAKQYDISLTHGFFIVMGGFVDSTGHPIVTHAQLKSPSVLAEIKAVSRSTIEDKSKGDLFSKGIALCQAIWFVAQCLSRRSEHIAISQLEISTLAFAAVTVCTRLVWWGKPLGVKEPVRLSTAAPVVQPKSQNLVAENVVQPLIAHLEDLGRNALENPPPQQNSNVKIENDVLSHVLHAILGGQIDYDPSLSYHVPTFWCAADDEWPLSYQATCAILELLCGSFFGALHCAAWSSQFPSTAELKLWRLSAFSIAVIPGVPSIVLLLIIPVKLNYGDALPNWVNEILAVFAFLSMPPFLAGILLYCFARILLLVLMLTTLRALPTLARDTSSSAPPPRLATLSSRPLQPVLPLPHTSALVIRKPSEPFSQRSPPGSCDVAPVPQKSITGYFEKNGACTIERDEQIMVFLMSPATLLCRLNPLDTAPSAPVGRQRISTTEPEIYVAGLGLKARRKLTVWKRETSFRHASSQDSSGIEMTASIVLAGPFVSPAISMLPGKPKIPASGPYQELKGVNEWQGAHEWLGSEEMSGRRQLPRNAAPTPSSYIVSFCAKLSPDYDHTASSSLSQTRLPARHHHFFRPEYCTNNLSLDYICPRLKRRQSSSTGDTDSSPALSSDIYTPPQVPSLPVRSLRACTADTSDPSSGCHTRHVTLRPRLCSAAHAPHTRISSVSGGAVPLCCATQFFPGDDVPGKALVDTVFSDVASKTVKVFFARPGQYAVDIVVRGHAIFCLSMSWGRILPPAIPWALRWPGHRHPPCKSCQRPRAFSLFANQGLWAI